MKEDLREFISSDIDNNIEYLKELFKDNSDVVFREFYASCNKKVFLIYIDGIGNKDMLDDFVIESLMLTDKEISVKEFKSKLLTVSDLREIENLTEGIQAILSGDTMMLMEGVSIGYVIASRSWPVRGISEPSGETVIRGGRDGFSETIRFNTALIRRRIRDTSLKVKSQVIGRRSKSDVVVMYIEDIAEDSIVKEVFNRLDKIDIDAILDSGYIEQFIEDDKWSLFPQCQSTERPDVVAGALYEGRIAIIVDNSPFVLIVPATLPNLFQSPDDYYQRWMYGTVLRIIRVFSVIISLVLPALYVAVTSFNPQIIPTKMAYFIASSREGVPFPAFLEAIIMEFSMAFLTEAIVRLPKPIGSTIGIVGGLIIGQAAVSAGIVSPTMIIIVSLTTITTFTIPNYDVNSAFRIIRFILIIASAIIGLYGIMIGMIILLIHLIKLKSFGKPYLSPLVNPNIRDFKDMFIRFPLKYFKKRPEYMKTKDKIRQK